MVFTVVLHKKSLFKHFRVKKLQKFIFKMFISYENPKFIQKYHHFNDSMLADFLHNEAQNFAVRILSCSSIIKFILLFNATRLQFQSSQEPLVESLTSPFLLVFAQFCIENASVRTANRLIRLSSNSWVISLIWSRAWRHEHFCASTIAINPLLSVCLLKSKTK